MVDVARVLVIEDDDGIRSALVRALSARGHAVLTQPAGMPGLQSALEAEADLVLLDLGLPDLDGLTVLGMLRAVRHTPVIVITAREDGQSIVRALDAGADDYVTKPFAMDQLEARLRAVLRRAGDAPPAPVAVGALVVDPTSRQVSLRGEPLELSRREFDLLFLLARRAGEVVSKREILAEVWNQAYGGGERTVDVHLSWLRRKLGESAAHPVYLHSVRGVGVRLAPPDGG